MSDTRPTPKPGSKSARAPERLPAVHGAGDAPATVAAQADDGRADYEVTHLAGPRVAGQRVKAGDILRLTEPEARSDLLNAALVPAGAPLPEAIRADTQASAEAAGDPADDASKAV